jgi:Methyltransferase domain
VHSIYGPFQRRFRPRRLRLFYSTFAITTETRLLDLGGGLYFWELARNEGFPVPQVTVLNIRPGPAQLPPQIKWVVGDAKRTNLEDFSFDIVFSNSLVEHLVDWDSQVQFATEVRRLAHNYFVQTPNKWFFVEPHFVTPFTHWLPMPVRRKLGPRATLWGWSSGATHKQYEAQLREIRLLSTDEMRALFPDSELISERFFRFTKSIIAVRSKERA